MISLTLARQLRDAGLEWRPSERDFFALPDRQMDHQIFVVNHLPALIQWWSGEWNVTFHGSSEWALDHILLAEAVWLPTESQLREALEQHVPVGAQLLLERTSRGYRCRVDLGTGARDFDAPEAETAYGLALLHVLETARP